MLLKITILISISAKMIWYFVYKIPKYLHNVLIKIFRHGEGTTHTSHVLPDLIKTSVKKTELRIKYWCMAMV